MDAWKTRVHALSPLEHKMKSLPNTPQTGLLIAMTAFLVAPGMDVLAKLLTATLSPGMIVVGRFIAQTVLILPLVLAFGQWQRPVRGHIQAGVFLSLALLTINAALAVMPIANAIAIFFVEPLILTILSAIFLGERIGWRRILAVCVGLVGAIIVLRPNLAAYGASALLPLATAFFFAGYMMTTKVLAAGPNRLALQLWTGVFALLSMLCASILFPVVGLDGTDLAVPDQRELMLFLAMGLIALLSHQLIVHALVRIDASVVAPMQYLEIVSAVLFGWLIFNDLPDLLTWVGTAIIIGAGVYVFHRERTVQQEEP